MVKNMTKKITEEDYLTTDDLTNEMADFIPIELSDGKHVVVRKLSKDEESKIRVKHTKMQYDKKTKQSVTKLEEEDYQASILAAGLVKPKLTLAQVKAMSSTRFLELVFKYNEVVGLTTITQNLGLMPKVI